MELRGSRKPYVRPDVESYGDIRGVTATLKQFGLADGIILVTNNNQQSLKALS